MSDRINGYPTPTPRYTLHDSDRRTILYALSALERNALDRDEEGIVDQIHDAREALGTGTHVLTFPTVAEREAYIDEFYPDRAASDEAPGLYILPDGRGLGVLGDTVTIYPAPAA